MNSIDIDEFQEYRKIDVNEIKTKPSSVFIAAIEHNQFIRESWFQKCSMKDKFESWSDQNMQEPNFTRQIDPELHGFHRYTNSYPSTSLEVSAIEALSKQWFENDVRPKLYDKISKTWILCDSGSVVTCIPKQPNDVIDTSIRLKSVNGGAIPTFGSEELTIRLGRKSYSIQAIKADIPQKILGWDFFRKFKLNLEWGEFGDLLLVDKKADTRSLLKCEKIDQSQRIEAIDGYEDLEFEMSSEMVQFQTNCMKWLDEQTFDEATSAGQIDSLTIDPDHPSPIADNLPLSSEVDPDANKSYLKNVEALKALKEPFKSLVEKYAILKANFKKEPTTDIFHRIETTGEPFKSKVRPLLASSEKYIKGKKIWEEMERLGVVERVKQNTTLKYTSPLHMVKKPGTDSYRVCADFRLLNSRTQADNYPLPLLRSFQGKIKGSKVFSKLDLTSAFHHLPIHPDDVDKTCVLSPWGGAFVFKRVAFGLTNGPASWQKYIDGILSGIDDQFCYLDDILVASESMESHMSTLAKIFDRLQQHNLTLSLDKCVFGQTTVDYLGYHVSATGICPQKRKVEAIQKIQPPTSQKLLLQFLGALNYFRSSLSGLMKNGKYNNAANLLQPLYSAATVPIPAQKFVEVWKNSPCLQNAFEDAKKLLSMAAELSHPDPSLPLALMTDASQHSVGAVLMQRNRNGKWSPLGYMSRHLPIEKVNWSTCRKETLAAQAGLRYFISEIYGRHCTIFSDHAPLVLAFKNPQGFQLHDPVMQRALMEIGQFTKDVQHIAGLHNGGSDFLSRIPPETKGSAYDDDASLSSTSQSSVVDQKMSPKATYEKMQESRVAAIEGMKLECVSPAVIAEAQENCTEVELIKSGKHPTSVIFEQVRIGNHILLCEMCQSVPRPFLPKNLRSFVTKQMHFAHDGIKESVRKISSHYYWTEMKKDITNFVQTCHGCQEAKPSRVKPPNFGYFEVPDQRFSHCHIDVVGPMPESEGYRYLLTIMDRTTRHLSALPMKEPSAKTCSQAFLLHYVALYGIPSACTSDQGKNFISSLFQEMQSGLGIQINHTPIYWPQGNGLVERSHQTLKTKIKAQLAEMGQKYQKDWIKMLPWALLGQRTAFNKDLGTSSSELTLGTHIQVPGCILSEPTAEEPDISKILSNLQIKNARSAVPTSKNLQKEVLPPSQAVTHVYVKQHDTRGLETRYRGPFLIVRRPTRSTVEIKVGLDRHGENRTELRAWSDCKPAYLRESAKEAERPKRGRPRKKELQISEEPTVLNDKEDPDSQPFHGFATQEVAGIMFSRPPPPFPNSTSADPKYKMWSASKAQLNAINRSIVGS